MATPPPPVSFRRMSYFFPGRSHGDATERRPEKARDVKKAATRHAVEAVAEDRQLRALTDWYD